MWVSVFDTNLPITVNMRQKRVTKRVKYKNIETVTPKDREAPLTCEPPNMIRRLSACHQVTQSTNEMSVEFKAYSGEKGQKKHSTVYVKPIICFRLQGVIIWKLLREDGSFPSLHRKRRGCLLAELTQHPFSSLKSSDLKSRNLYSQ